LDEAALSLVDHDPGGGVKGVDETDPFIDPALLYGIVHLMSYIYDLNGLFCFYLNHYDHLNFCWMIISDGGDLSRTGRE
jgi:hypothetical protein